MTPLQVGDVRIGDGALALIAGPCVVETRDRTLRIAERLAGACARRDLPLVFKASFDKANRSRGGARRGVGIDEGLAVLAEVRSELGIPITTDVHLPQQAAIVGQVVDLLQVPAFLCRQTDLLVACGATGKPVNIKKGQFMAPWDMVGAIEKVGGPAMLTERGTTFGYNRLVVDMLSLPRMRALGVPVCMDATHATQQPAGRGDSSGGEREFAPHLALAAVAVGVDALFIEVHDDPDSAWSDAATQLPLDGVEDLLDRVLSVDRAVR
ncbi:MAG: 3-deoxy-8-phosphooctulonate synthase [Proteobacteria bacterium]|nr:3-deoxy-8-phosphooctulonate synthase [Pseudomonadota bacterium]MCP4920529.1 3-deoxy-8-phosphooctulonate synthase [Pseudomonadota bacterium]